MPIYEYTCGQCDHAFELLLKTAREGAHVTCPSCGAKDVQQRLSVFAAGSSTDSASMPADSPCSRCGDPNGPCPLQSSM